MSAFQPEPNKGVSFHEQRTSCGLLEGSSADPYKEPAVVMGCPEEGTADRPSLSINPTFGPKDSVANAGRDEDQRARLVTNLSPVVDERGRSAFREKYSYTLKCQY